MNIWTMARERAALMNTQAESESERIVLNNLVADRTSRMEQWLSITNLVNPFHPGMKETA